MRLAVAVLMSACLAGGLAACGDDEEASDNAGATTAQADTSAQEAEREAAEQAEAERKARAERRRERARALRAERRRAARARRARAARRRERERQQQLEAEREQEEQEQQAKPEPASDCDPNYDPCVPSYPPDLDCPDIGQPVTVTGSDPHGLDADSDGAGCESQ